MKSRYLEDCKRLYAIAKNTVLAGSNWRKDFKIGRDLFIKDDLIIYDPKDKTLEEKSFIRKTLSDKGKIHEFYGKYLMNNPLYYFENQISSISKFSEGNCEEFAVVISYYCLLENIPAERIYYTNIDHCCVVIGRDPESDPTNPLTWGSDAMICDPWKGEYFPASEFNEKNQDFVHDQVNFEIESILDLRSLRTFEKLKDFFLNGVAEVIKKLKERRQNLLPEEKRLAKMSSSFKAHIKQIDEVVHCLETTTSDIYEACYKEAKKEAKEEQIHLAKFNKIPALTLDVFSKTRVNLVKVLDNANELLNNFSAYFELKNLMLEVANISVLSPKKSLLNSILKEMTSIYNEFDEKKYLGNVTVPDTDMTIDKIRILAKNILWIVLQKDNKNTFPTVTPRGFFLNPAINQNRCHELLKILDIEMEGDTLRYKDLIKYITNQTQPELFDKRFNNQFSYLEKLEKINYFFTVDESKVRTAYRSIGKPLPLLQQYKDTTDTLPTEIKLYLSKLFENSIKNNNFDTLTLIFESNFKHVEFDFIELMTNLLEAKHTECLVAYLASSKKNNGAKDTYDNVSSFLRSPKLIEDKKAADFFIETVENMVDIPPLFAPLKHIAALEELVIAARDGDIDRVEKYIKLETPINCKSIIYKDTPLLAAVDSESMECVQALLNAGADMQIGSIYSDTPLHVAIENKHFAFAELLISSGADVRAKNFYSVTPIDLINGLPGSLESFKEILLALIEEQSFRKSP